MQIAKKTVLITGANRGIGEALVKEALNRGAKRVIAGTRGALSNTDPRVTALTLDKNTLHYKQKLSLDWAEMVYNGLWFTPLREALDGFFDKVSEPTTGEVKLQLYKGNITPLSRKSPNSLYSLDIASFTMGASYDQKDALGFINLIGLPMKVRAALSTKSK